MPKKLTPTTPMDDAIRRMADGNPLAASVMAMLIREKPREFMGYMNSMDDKGLYGQAIADKFFRESKGIMNDFLNKIA